jgi:hypothetical protein
VTLMQIEKRVKTLEQIINGLTEAKRPANRRLYCSQAGRFAGDPVFDKIVKLGRAFRNSQRPKVNSKRS